MIRNHRDLDRRTLLVDAVTAVGDFHESVAR